VSATDLLLQDPIMMMHLHLRMPLHPTTGLTLLQPILKTALMHSSPPGNMRRHRTPPVLLVQTFGHNGVFL